MPDRPPDALTPAEALFAEWFTRETEGGTAQDLEALCRAHANQAGELRRLWVSWESLRNVLEKAGFHAGPRSLADRIREKHGSGVDPNVSIGEGDQGEEQLPSSALLKRLAEHTLRTSRYALHGEIARGGMGAILKVFDQDLRRNLAMKVILGKAEEASTGKTPPIDRRLLTRFLEEAQVTGQLDHPGIVPVHELGLDAEGHVYFTMKLVKGRDLKRVFELFFEGQADWNETRALGVLLKVCEAMAYAHRKGVIHRDLKPANVMVGDFGEVYVMDWGLARVLGRADQHDIRLQVEGAPLTSLKTERREAREESPDSPLFTMDGDVVGTPAYMSPEQARGEIERLSARSDVYAVGAMLYHLLARQMPYVPHGARVTNRSVLMMVLHGPPPALHTIRRDVPAELVAIAEKGMAREPEQRYVDTLELAQDLRAYLEHRVVRAYRTGTLVELRKWVERNKALAASAAGAVLLLIAGLTTTLVFKVHSDRNAKLAEENAAQAKANAAESTRNAQVASQNERRARENEQLATARANDVLSLSALQRLDDQLAEADRLWPAHPESIQPYDAWLQRAQALVAELVLDGVYSSASPFSRPIFQRAEPLSDQDVIEVTTRLHRRILRYLTRCGRLPKAEPDEDEVQPDEPLLAELYAASVQGRVAIGEKSGTTVVERLGRRRDARPLFLPGALCCDLDGFSLHAKVEIEAHDHDGLERLCRYLARPPIATERLALRSDGRVIYGLRRHWKDGTSAVVFDPLDFIARLAALVPRPRAHQLTYHGVLAPAAEWRDLVVPVGQRSIRKEPSQSLAAKALRPSRSKWAELLERVFEIDALTCPYCGGKRRLIALLTDGQVVRKILAHLSLAIEAPRLAPARAPPELEFAG